MTDTAPTPNDVVKIDTADAIEPVFFTADTTTPTYVWADRCQANARAASPPSHYD